MQVAEASDPGVSVDVSSTPVHLGSSIWRQGDQTEWTGSRSKVEEPRLDRVDPRLDQINSPMRLTLLHLKILTPEAEEIRSCGRIIELVHC